MSELDPASLAEIALRSLAVSACALGGAVALGLPLGILLGKRRFLGRGTAVSLVNAAMGLPPVVVGLGVALLLWRSGPLGDFFVEGAYEAQLWTDGGAPTITFAGFNGFSLALGLEI